MTESQFNEYVEHSLASLFPELGEFHCFKTVVKMCDVPNLLAGDFRNLFASELPVGRVDLGDLGLDFEGAGYDW